MKLKVLSTGSGGNCYLLEGEGKSLLLDAGIPIAKIINGIDHLSDVTACLITHEHMDHAKAARDVAGMGIRTIASAGTWKVIRSNGIWSQEAAVAGQIIRLDGFTVLPFKTQHDAAEPLGYLIRYDKSGEMILYATDTYYLRDTYPGVHYWLVECNYCDDLLDEMLFNGVLNLELRNRLKKSHLSLNRLKEALAANDLSSTRMIVLCHLSDVRSDEERMVREIYAQTGIETIAADAGMEIDLNLTPF